MQALDKALPSSIDAERILLGAILMDNAFIGDAAEQLVPEDFYSPMHSQTFKAMLTLYASSQPLDPVGVAEAAKREGAELSVALIAQLLHGLPVLSTIDRYIDVLVEKSRARKFIRTCNGGVINAMSETDEIQEVIDQVEQGLYDLRAVKAGGMENLRDLVFESVTEVGERAKSGVSVLGLPTGFRDIDALTGGFQKTDLIILAARPSMGKSALSLDICKGVTDSTPEAVIAYFSLEMSKRQCADRMICSIAEVDSSRYRVGMMSQREWDYVLEAAKGLENRHIHVDDAPALSVFDIKSKARRVAMKEGRLDLIVIDYLQLMRGARRTESRQQEVSDISRDLKALAKDMGVPVVALSQLSRSCETRQDKRPLLSDLRESGAIEQDADIVAFLYRDEYYNEPTIETAGKAELIFRKHRHGATDTVVLSFIKRFAKFANNMG